MRRALRLAGKTAPPWAADARRILDSLEPAGGQGKKSVASGPDSLVAGAYAHRIEPQLAARWTGATPGFQLGRLSGIAR